MRFSSWSCGSVLRLLDLYYKVAIFELELRKRTSRTTLFLQSCELRAGAAEVYFAYNTFSAKLRDSSWSCGSVLRLLHSVLQGCGIFKLELRNCRLRTTLCSAELRGSSWSSGSVLCVLHSFARLDLEQRELYFAYNTFSAKLRGSSWSSGSMLRVLHFFCKVARFELERCGSVLRVLNFFCKVARFELELRKLYFAYYTLFCKVCCGIFKLELRKRTSRTTLHTAKLRDSSCRAAEAYFAVLHFILQSCEIPAGAAEAYFAYYTLFCKVAGFELELRKRSSRTRLVLQSCKISSWSAAEAYLAYYSLFCKVAGFSSWSCGSCTSRTRLHTAKLRDSSWSCGSVLRVLDLRCKVAIFEL